MPNRLEWDDVQLRYKEALQNFLTLKEKPADEDEGAKEIPVITISDDNDTTMEVSAENVDDKNSVKKAVGGELDEPMSDVVEAAAKEDAGVKEVEPAAAVVVNPDSSITDKALTDKKQKFISLINLSLSHFHFPSIVLLLGSFLFFIFCSSSNLMRQNQVSVFFSCFDPIIKISFLH